MWEKCLTCNSLYTQITDIKHAESQQNLSLTLSEARFYLYSLSHGREISVFFFITLAPGIRISFPWVFPPSPSPPPCFLNPTLLISLEMAAARKLFRRIITIFRKIRQELDRFSVAMVRFWFYDVLWLKRVFFLIIIILCVCVVLKVFCSLGTEPLVLFQPNVSHDRTEHTEFTG